MVKWKVGGFAIWLLSQIKPPKGVGITEIVVE